MKFLEAKTPTRFLLRILFLTNIVVIPLTFLVAPFFINQVDGYAQFVYDMVDEEGKAMVDEKRQEYPLWFYVFPILGTNMVIMALSLVMFRK